MHSLSFLMPCFSIFEIKLFTVWRKENRGKESVITYEGSV